MQLIMIWVASIIASFGMEFVNSIQVFKDVMDAGYKIKMKNLRKFQQEINPDARKISLLSMLIPVYNIYTEMDTTIKYNQIKPYLLDELRILDSIEPLTKEEEEKYLRHPNVLNAVLISAKSEAIHELEEEGFKFTIKDKNKNEESVVRIRFENEKMTLLSVKGSLESYPKEEQEKIVTEHLKEFGNAIKEEYGTAEEFNNAINKKRNIKIKYGNKKDDKIVEDATNDINKTLRK